jgi:hypothetical protein
LTAVWASAAAPTNESAIARPNEATCNQAVRPARRSLEIARLISLESDHILYHAAKISPYLEIADQHKLFV